MLVTLPEETPVNEVVETAFKLEDRVGVKLAPVVVNGLYPPLDHLDEDPMEAAEAAGVRLTAAEADALRRAAEFRSHRRRLHTEQVARLADALPLPKSTCRSCSPTELGRAEVDVLADALAARASATLDSSRSGWGERAAREVTARLPRRSAGPSDGGRPAR